MTKYYSFDRQSRRYLGPCPIPASILDPVNGSATPANTLPIEPPVPPDNEAVLVNEAFDNWVLIPDFIGTIYQKADGKPVEHKELGPLPDTLTQLKPASQYDEWDDASGGWVKNKETEKSNYYERALESLKQERNHHRQQGLNYRGHQIEATEVDQSNIVAIITGYSEGIRAENAAVYWKVAPNQYLTLTGKPEAVALAAAMDTYVQTLFNIEAKLGQEVTTLTTEQLKAFDAKQRYQEELNQLT